MRWCDDVKAEKPSAAGEFWVSMSRCSKNAMIVRLGRSLGLARGKRVVSRVW